MSLERHKSFIDDHKGDQHGLGETYVRSGGFRRVTSGALSMEVGDEVVHAYATGAIVTITLPGVKEAIGKLYSIVCRNATYATYIVDKGDDAALSGIHLNYLGQWVALYSDGYQWIEVAGNHFKRHYIDRFDSQCLSTNIGGGESQTTGTNVLWTGDKGMSWETHVHGTQTIGPRRAATGLDIGADQTNNDGYEFCPSGPLAGHGLCFTIGSDPAFFAEMRFSIADVSGTDDCAFGFRLVEAFQDANIDDYNDMAVLNVISGNVTIETIVGGAATVPTDTAEDWGDGETHTLRVNVSAAGVVTYLFDGSAPTTVAAYTFTDAIVVTPFFFYNHAATSPGAIILQYFEAGLQ